jgi:adenine/guanine phosphoribosyltransferase-like PRPP-binding protein
MQQIPAIARHSLSTGVLELQTFAAPVDFELFRIAERINPKRSFLFVSTVLGRHIPVRPRDHFDAVNRIVDQIPDALLGGSLLVMGYAETAVGIGAAVARRIQERRPESDLLYLSTTRHPVAGQEWVSFSEGHSHATAHYVMTPTRCVLSNGPKRTLVLVDDETTTGNTFSALFRAVHDGGMDVGRVLLLTLTDWSSGRASRAIAELCPDIPVDSFSLMQGEWQWKQDASATLPVVPVWAGEATLPPWAPGLNSNSRPNPLFKAPRLGLRMETMIESMSESMPELVRPLIRGALPKIDAGDAVLVIGTGEHVWGPMLLAERLEQEGADVKFVATTRSPILNGEVIRHKVTFPDHYRVGVPMYLHNVPERPCARVIIMTETGDDGICPTLRAWLGRGHIINGAGQVTEFET